MPEKENVLKKAADNKLLIFLPAALVIVAILLGYFCAIFPLITGTISFGFEYLEWNIEHLIQNLFGGTGASLFAILLPVGVIVAKKVNKPALAKTFFFISLGFLAVQLFAAFICLIFSFFNIYGGFWGGVQDFFAGFCGAQVLSGLVYMVKDLFLDLDIIMTIGLVITDAVSAFAALLYILSNAICALLCLQMANKR